MSEIKLRKSLFMSFRRCQQQGVYNYAIQDDGYGDLNVENENLLKGQVFHHAMEDFYNTIEMSKLESTDNRLEYIRSLLPNPKQPDLSQWFDWYAKYESDRYNSMENKEYFMPFKTEYYVEAMVDGVKRTGHFDRIDRINETDICIIEYKTGKSYDPSKSYKLSDLRAELEWYHSILVKLDEFKDYNFTMWKMINPTLEIIHDGKFAITSQYAVNKNMGEIVEIIQGKREPKKNISMLCSWCPFKEECQGYTDPDHEIFGEISKEITK